MRKYVSTEIVDRHKQYKITTKQNKNIMKVTTATVAFLLGFAPLLYAWIPTSIASKCNVSKTTYLTMVMDQPMVDRLNGIKRSYNALTERLADPDVIANSNLLMKIMSDRSKSEEVVETFDKYTQLMEEFEGAEELFQEAGDDADMKEMARAEMKEIEIQVDELEANIQVLLLPVDPNDDRNVMLEIRAGTGGSEANIFAGATTARSYSLFPFVPDVNINDSYHSTGWFGFEMRILLYRLLITLLLRCFLTFFRRSS